MVSIHQRKKGFMALVKDSQNVIREVIEWAHGLRMDHGVLACLIWPHHH